MKCAITSFALFLLSLLPAALLSEEPYKVAAIIPLSGTYSGIGIYVKRGIDLAYESLTPEMRGRIKLYYEDDQLDSKRSISAFNRLAGSERIDAVFVMGSGVGNALAPIAEARKTVMIAVGASDKKFLAGKKFVFTHWVSPEMEARIMIQEIGRRGYRKIGLVSNEQEGIIAFCDALRAELEKAELSGLLVFEQRMPYEERDFRTFIAQARSRNLDGIAVALMPGSLSAFAKQAQGLKLSSELFGFELLEDEHEVKASDGALLGKWYVNIDSAAPDFQKSYRAKFKERPGFGSANGFDALNLIVAALSRAGHDNGKIADYLRTVKDFSGAAGTYSATGDNRFDLPVAVKIVTEDGFEKIRP